MKVIYTACWADPWIKVAEKLQKEQAVDPIIWIGYEEDNSMNLVPEKFPDIKYIHYYDGWKGIFPKAFHHIIKDANHDLDFLKNSAHEELQAIKMMDRMDPDQHSFSFMERQRLFRNALKNWLAIINYYKPDAVIGATVPHRIYDYILYLICQYRNIPNIALRETAFLGRTVVVSNIQRLSPNIKNDFRKNIALDIPKEELILSIPDDIFSRYKKVNQDYNTAEPQYMKKHVDVNKKEATLTGNIKKLLDKTKRNQSTLLGKDGHLRKGFPTYHKKQNASIEQSAFNLLHYSKRKIAANKFKIKLRDYYNSLIDNPDFSINYVLFALHYQPEMTSNPSGDIFADQLLCVDVLAKHLPDNYKIYVKEHRSQFYSHTEGHTARIKEFYTDLRAYSKVKLMPLEADTFELISHSSAVSTVTGTVGWEAMARKKPVIIFGMSWYQDYYGVLKVIDEDSAKKIPGFIKSYKFDEHALLCYLDALGKSSLKAYYFRGLKEKMDLSESECVNNLTQALIDELIEVKENK